MRSHVVETSSPPWRNPEEPSTTLRRQLGRRVVSLQVGTLQVSLHESLVWIPNAAGKLLRCGANEGNDTVHPTRTSRRNADFAHLNTRRLWTTDSSIHNAFTLLSERVELCASKRRLHRSSPTFRTSSRRGSTGL